MRKLKKGFTIVELVIVIAVIAILSAVLVPTFIHLTKKAKDASDKTVVKNANIQLAAQEQTQGKNKSMSDAVKDVDEIGYHIPGVETGNGNKIVWDSVSDRFVLLDKDGNVLLKDSETVADHSKLFLAVSSLSERGDFAVYAKSSYNDSTSFTSPISFDAGDKEGIEEVKYSLGATDSSTVIVATNSIDTDLTVYGPAATFNHVGLVGNEYILAAAPESFHEFGRAAFAKVDIGHYVAEPGAVVKAVYTTSNASIIDRNGGTIEKAYGSEAAVTNPEGNVVLEPFDSNVSMEDIQEAAYDDLNREVNPPSGPALVGSPVSNFLELAAAFANGGEYYLTDNFEVTSALQTTHNLVLDLNGHNLNLNSSNNISATVLSASNCNITFNDSLGTGGIYNIKESYTDALFGMFGAGDFIINGGTFLSTDDMLFGGVGGTSGGRFVINGGTILGYVGTLQGKTIVLGQEMTLKYVNDALPLEFLDTHVVGAEGYTVTKIGDWDPIIYYVCTKD